MEEDVRSIVPTIFDSGLLDQLVATGCHIQHPDRYFAFVEQRLPIVGSMASGGEWLCAKGPASSYDEWLDTLRSAITRGVGDASPHDVAVVVGDNMTNYAYTLRYGQFIAHVGDFFSIPQDTYVLLQSNKVCLQYTFEDELFLYRLE